MAKQPGQAQAKRLRLNPEVLTEDDVDYLYALQHKGDPSYPLDEFLSRLGYEDVAAARWCSK